MQVVNLHLKLIAAAGLKWKAPHKAWAKPILGFDTTKTDGWRFKSRDGIPFIKSIDYFDVPQKPLVMLCCAYQSDSFAKYAIVVWDGNAMYRTKIRTEATKWAMDITLQVEDLFNLIQAGEPWEHYIAGPDDPVDLFEEPVEEKLTDTKVIEEFTAVPLSQKIKKSKKEKKTIHEAAKEEFGVIKITPKRKELIDAINELSEKCPGMSLWSTLLIAVGPSKDSDISDEMLIDLVFDYTMSIAGENLALD